MNQYRFYNYYLAEKYIIFYGLLYITCYSYIKSLAIYIVVQYQLKWIKFWLLMLNTKLYV